MVHRTLWHQRLKTLQPSGVIIYQSFLLLIQVTLQNKLKTLFCLSFCPLGALSASLSASLGSMGSIAYTSTAHCALIKEAYSEYIELWQRDPWGCSGALYILEIYFDVLGGGPRSLDAIHSWSRRTIVCGKDVLMHSLAEYFEMLITLNSDTISTAMGISSTSNLHVWGLLWRQMSLDAQGNIAPATDWKLSLIHI